MKYLSGYASKGSISYYLLNELALAKGLVLGITGVESESSQCPTVTSLI